MPAAMKRLILLRHAKAVPGGEGADHDRDLSPRGRRDAAWAGSTIAARGWAPDVALVSDARRTLRTFDEALPLLSQPPALVVEPRLYDASIETILRCIAEAPPQAACLLVVGHNPGVSLTASHLGRAERDSDARTRLGSGFPTASLAVFALHAAVWSGVEDATATLEAFLSPH